MMYLILLLCILCGLTAFDFHDLISQGGREFEVERLGGGLHLRGQLLYDAVLFRLRKLLLLFLMRF